METVSSSGWHAQSVLACFLRVESCLSVSIPVVQSAFILVNNLLRRVSTLYVDKRAIFVFVDVIRMFHVVALVNFG